MKGKVGSFCCGGMVEYAGIISGHIFPETLADIDLLIY